VTSDDDDVRTVAAYEELPLPLGLAPARRGLEPRASTTPEPHRASAGALWARERGSLRDAETRVAAPLPPRAPSGPRATDASSGAVRAVEGAGPSRLHWASGPTVIGAPEPLPEDAVFEATAAIDGAWLFAQKSDTQPVVEPSDPLVVPVGSDPSAHAHDAVRPRTPRPRGPGFLEVAPQRYIDTQITSAPATPTTAPAEALEEITPVEDEPKIFPVVLTLLLTLAATVVLATQLAT
jgi:hypothetical protein